MKYRSTRGAKDNALTSPAAIIQGLAQDGGLYVPVDFPKANFQLEDLPKLSYKQISAMIISLFFDDFSLFIYPPLVSTLSFVKVYHFF